MEHANHVTGWMLMGANEEVVRDRLTCCATMRRQRVEETGQSLASLVHGVKQEGQHSHTLLRITRGQLAQMRRQ
jgi:hypothetical protein